MKKRNIIDNVSVFIITFSTVYTLEIDRNVKDISYVVLSEDIAKGQRVENFMICADTDWGRNYPLYHGNCIDHKKICCINNPFEEHVAGTVRRCEKA